MFLTIFMSYYVSLSFSSFVRVLAIFQILQMCVPHLPRFFRYSLHNPGPTVCIFHISGFSIFLTIFQFLQCVFLTLHVFQCFLPCFMSYHVSFSWFSFVSFLIIYQVLQCEFLLFQVGQFFCHIPGPTVCVSHFARFSVFIAYFMSYHDSFSFSSFVSFLVICQVLQSVFLIFHIFHCFSSYSRSYIVCVIFDDL